MNLRNNSLRRLSMAAMAACLAATSAGALAETEEAHDAVHHGRFSFGLWGDMPYAKNGDGPKIPALVASMNAAHLAFTVFDGDVKDGSSPCTDGLIGRQAVDRFNQLRAPMVYVPGDNEWTDCHRINNGGYNALERLGFLRSQLANTEYSFGRRKMELERQGRPGQPYSENTRWVYGKVVFVGLNVPGSNDNKVNDGACLSKKSVRTLADCADDNAEYADRNAHNLAWLKESFDIAKARGAAGVMVVIQADPGFDLPETEDVNERNLPDDNGYTDFLDALASETQAFPGQVVLVHGDTHFFKIDKPLFSQKEMLRNFTRVETFGSPNVHWVKVTVEPRSANVFRFEPVIVPGN